MRACSRGWRVLFAGLTLVVVTGCAGNTTFVYKTAAPTAGGPKLPVKVAVLTFKDGTEDFTRRGSVFAPESLLFNLAKAGIGGQTTALTPDLWAKAFADDMTASGSFQAVRFAYSLSELTDEEFYIEGTVVKASISGAWGIPSEFALGLRALRKADNRLIWQKEVSKVWANTPALYEGCGAMSVQCMVDRGHADMNRVMQGLFAESRADLVRTLASHSGNPVEAEGRSPFGPSGETPEENIVGIGIRVRSGNSGLVVESVIEGMPAWKAGVYSGDSIVSVDDTPATAMSIVDAVGRLRGVKGTAVTLGVMRAGWNAPRDFRLVRDVIKNNSPAQQAPESVDETIESILKSK